VFNFPHHLITFSVVSLHYIALLLMAILQFANSSFVREPKSTQKPQGTEPNFFDFFVPKPCFFCVELFNVLIAVSVVGLHFISLPMMAIWKRAKFSFRRKPTWLQGGAAAAGAARGFH
jgi:hypothetical protein